MFNRIYISILGSGTILLGCVAIILVSIALLKKGKQYTKFMRGLMIALLILILCVAVFLLYLAIALGNPHLAVFTLPLDGFYSLILVA